MPLLLLENGVLLDPEAPEPALGSLLVEGERIVAQLRPGEAAPDNAKRLDLQGARLCPGLIDLHFHGETVFGPADEAESGLERDSALLVRHGVTAFLATTLAAPARELVARVNGLRDACARSRWPGAVPLGIHLEGPWIRREAAGAQPIQGIRPYDAGEGRELFARSEAALRVVTLAPEVPGAEGLLHELARRGIVASLGHSLADEAQVHDAVSAGARHVTHLFNAMGPFHQRVPGLAGAALAESRLSCDLICDGAHVHPDWVRVAARAKGEGLVLVSDHVTPPPAGAGSAGPFEADVRDDGIALRMPDGRLAGSSLMLDRALGNVEKWGALSLLEAVAGASLRPARLLGLEATYGTLRPGARADLAIFEGSGILRETWLAGRLVHSRGA